VEERPVSQSERPNVILITTDQQRYDTLGIAGNAGIRTPNIDALAGRGALFEHAYIQNTVCIPSRACLQTGRYTHQHGVMYMESEIDNTPGLPEWELTFMEHLQMAGYRTGATGKIHMMPQKGFNFERLCGGKGARWTRSQGLPIGPGPLGPAYASWLEARRPGAYEEIYEQRRRPEYRDHMTAVVNVLPLEDYVDYWIAESSIEFIHHSGPDPFFLWVGFCGPHGPIDPPEPYDRLYGWNDVPLPRQRTDEPPSSPKGRPTSRWAEDETLIRRWRAYYWGLVTLIDDQIGRIVNVLESRNLLDNTLIALVSDHGEMAGDYNLMGKGNFYEEVVRVPMVVVPPGGCSAGLRVPGLVETSDLAPTILDYANVQIPPQMSASSLRPILEGKGGTRDTVLCEYMTNDRARKAKCIRSERYKYVFWGRGERAEFYDLQRDPDEMRNLIDDDAYTAEVADHKDRLLDRLMQSERHYYADRTPSARSLKTWM